MITKKKFSKETMIFEGMLIVVAIGMSFLLLRMGGHKMVVLNLFYLPIVLAGYYLGRTNAGILALFSVLAASIAMTFDNSGFASFSTPMAVGLALTVWAGCLGLTAILIGTLCDERARSVDELHGAYVGVVEVLATYLQNASPTGKARAIRIAELSQKVATHLKLTHREVDDIRVAALLYDLGNVEITTQLLSKAVDTVESDPTTAGRYTFSGTDLVHSLGAVLSGALPLILNQDATAREILSADSNNTHKVMPIGGDILCAVRAFDSFTNGLIGDKPLSTHDALMEMRKDSAAGYNPDVLNVIETIGPLPSKEASPELATAY